MCRMLGITNFDYRDHRLLCESFLELAVSGKLLPGDPPGHADGWGIGYFTDKEAKVFKSGRSAMDEASTYRQKLEEIGRSPVIIIHLRKSAWPKTNSSENAHPFLFGNVIFGHNGTIRDYNGLVNKISTVPKPPPEALDSEIFSRYVMNYGSLGLERAFGTAVEDIRAHHTYSALNCLFSEGSVLYAYRDYKANPDYYSLYAASSGRANIVSSEPLRPVTGWQPLKENTLCRY